MLDIHNMIQYCPNTGQFTWIKSPATNIKVGQIAGTINKLGYVIIGYNYKTYYAHRLAFKLMGEDIDGYEVDHIDHDPTNNRWDNLRIVSSSQNKHNSRGHSDSHLKIKNITLNDDGTGRYSYYVRMTKDGKTYRKTFPHSDEGLQMAIAYRDGLSSTLHKEYGCTTNIHK